MNSWLLSWLSEYVDFNSLDEIAESSLDSIVIDLLVSNNCNLFCKHCYFGDTNTISRPLILEEWESLIAQLYQKGGRHFHISGKESFLDTRVPGLISAIKTLPGTYSGLVSNGTGALSFYNSVIENGADYLEFSIDGLKETHDYQRGAPVFKKVLNTLQGLSKYSRLIDISTCLNKNSLHEYFDLIDICYDLGIRKFFATPFYEKGNGRDFSSFSITAHDYSSLIEHTYSFFQKHKGDGIIIKYCIPHDFTPHLIQDSPFFNNLLIGYLKNNNGLTFRDNNNIMQIALNLFDINYLHNISVTTDGEVIPCADDICVHDYRTISLGNVVSDSIDSILDKRVTIIRETINSISHGN